MAGVRCVCDFLLSFNSHTKKRNVKLTVLRREIEEISISLRAPLLEYIRTNDIVDCLQFGFVLQKKVRRKFHSCHKTENILYFRVVLFVQPGVEV